ncbi:hypothetical protein C1645_740127 [Glomus cerebriforme]|uniref:PH domain-containing protein n=1 Tax=Glomus cerebriforme TaxID=658196 RepID=A0A397SXD9_9GLOM|nr:hypothetical protein C1645_740127 [Glomus cerebriforme]
MSDAIHHSIEYYKAELSKKDEIIEKLSKEVDILKDKQQEHNLESTLKSRERELENQLKELKIQYQELSNINYNLKIENENIKIENEKLLKDLKKKEFKVGENEEKKEVTDVRNNRQNSLQSQESAQEGVETASIPEATDPLIPEGIKTGTLYKQSQLLKTFNQRYFVLTKDTLYYYRSSNDPSNEKLIDLSSDCNVKIIEGAKFDLETKSRTYTLIADSEEERDLWIKELEECNVNVVPSEKEKSTFSKKTEEATKHEISKSENEDDINIQQNPVIPEGIKTGNLHKQSQLLKTFNQRYFVLTKDKLYYYKSSNDPSSQKSIDLSFDCKIKMGEGAKFDFETKSRTYKLIADSEEERDSWIKELKKCNVIVIPYETKKSSSSKKIEATKLEVPKGENENDSDIQQSVDNAIDNTVDKSVDVVETSV